MPSVSVVTPAYNAAPFIEETIRSVHGQVHRPLQHIVVDDCSPDTQNQVIERLREELSGDGYRLDLIRHEVNRGAAAALLTGIDAADADAICWLSADDLFVDAAKTTEQLALLAGADIVFDDACLEGPDPTEAAVTRPDWPPAMRRSRALQRWEPSAVTAGLLFQNPINGTSVMIRAEVLRDHLSFDRALGNLDADADFFLRASALGLRIRARRGVGTLYRIHPGQTSQQVEAMALGRAVSRIRLLQALIQEDRMAAFLAENRSVLASGILGGHYCSPTTIAFLAEQLRRAADWRLRQLGSVATAMLRIRRLPVLPMPQLQSRIDETTDSRQFRSFLDQLSTR